MVVCSKCGTDIEMNFCPKCGQEHRKEGLTMWAVVKDYFNSFFSLDDSLLHDVREFFLRPRQFVGNYWNGFRRGQSSPNRILVLSTIFVGLALLSSDSHFLGLQLFIENFSAPLFVLILFLPTLSLSSYLGYWPEKRTFAEHLSLNSYTLGMSLVVLSPLSVIGAFIEQRWYFSTLQVGFVVIPFVWTARVFHKTWWKTLLHLFLQLLVCAVLITGLIYFIKANSSSS